MHELSVNMVFEDVADIRDSSALWLIPLLNGYRDHVPNKNSQLLDKLLSDIFGMKHIAVYTDLFDPVPHFVIQLLCWASFRSYGRSGRPGGLKEERVLIHQSMYIYIDSCISITNSTYVYTSPRFNVPPEPSASPSSASPSSASSPL